MSVAEIPSHNHYFSATTSTNGAHTHNNVDWLNTSWTNGVTNRRCVAWDTQNIQNGAATMSAGDHNHTVSGYTSSVGSSYAHNNLQPYVVTYMWKRVS